MLIALVQDADGEEDLECPDEAEDEYDDNSVVVKHSGQRRLPALHLRCRWRKPSSRSGLTGLVRV